MTPNPSTHPSFDTTRLPDAVQRLATSVVGLSMRRGAASGLCWQAGVVVTTASAVWRAHRLQVVLPDGEPVAGEIRGVDPATDLAVVGYADGSGATATAAPERAPAETAARVGDFVFAVGRETSGRVQASFGHIGAAGGEWRTWRGGRVEQLLRLDGGLYPGLAGAPVADAAGRLLGIASPALSRHHGVVLPTATIDRVLPQLLAHGKVASGYLGIAAQPVRALLDSLPADGLLISSLADDGPAARAGLLVGDVIVAVDGHPVASIEALRDRLAAAVGSAGVSLKVARGGHGVDITAAVGERPARGCR